MVTNQENQKLTSSLNVPLTDDEYTRLQTLAADMGMKPSGYARRVLLATLKPNAKSSSQDAADSEPEEQTGENRTGICVFDIGSIQLNPQAAHALMETLKKFTNCKTITPKDMGYEEAERLITEEI